MSTREGSLRGLSIFLSASIPVRPDFRRISGAAVEIEEAVISFARAVLREDGIIVFGAHPSISPLVSSVATEYLAPRIHTDEPPEVESIGVAKRSGPGVVIYQSHAYDGYLPDKTWEMFRLGYADLVWCRSQGGEHFDPERKEVQCPRSLEFMRKQMFRKESPSAMVAIAGMEGVIDEAKLFLDDKREQNALGLNSPVYLMETTGGAAERLAQETWPSWLWPPPHRVESEWKQNVPGSVVESASRPDPRAPRDFVPYPLIAQWLVQQIAKKHRT